MCGEMVYVTPRTATYNAISAENADTDSAKQVGTAMTILNAFKRFIERFYVASPAYLLIAKYASPRRKGRKTWPK